MKRIAIFTSGEGECAKHLVPLFNNGDKIHIDLVVTERGDNQLIEQMLRNGVNALFLPRAVWQVNPDEVIKLLADNNIDILALDDFSGDLPEKIKETFEGRIVNLTSPEMAAGEIESIIHKDSSISVDSTVGPDLSKSVDEEWAETLKIKFDPSQVAQTPPPIPVVETPQPHSPQQQSYAFQQQAYAPPRQQYAESLQLHHTATQGEPMPSSYLIWAILSTVLCCTIPGIVAIIYSSQVSSKYYSGEIEGSKRASRNAQIWIIVSFVLGVLSSTLYLPIMIATSSL